MAPLCVLAYIDPGLGMLLLQGLVAVVATCAFFYHRYILGSLRWLFRLGRKRAADDSAAEEPASGGEGAEADG